MSNSVKFLQYGVHLYDIFSSLDLPKPEGSGCVRIFWSGIQRSKIAEMAGDLGLYSLKMEYFEATTTSTPRSLLMMYCCPNDEIMLEKAGQYSDIFIFHTVEQAKYVAEHIYENLSKN